jgi:hypothetical protein
MNRNQALKRVGKPWNFCIRFETFNSLITELCGCCGDQGLLHIKETIMLLDCIDADIAFPVFVYCFILNKLLIINLDILSIRNSYQSDM